MGFLFVKAGFLESGHSVDEKVYFGRFVLQNVKWSKPRERPG
jgi:hypothetical protein